MAAKPVQVSIDEDLLRKIDDDPEVRQKGRSAFIRSAVELYLRAKERRVVDEEIYRAYARASSDMLDEVAELIPEQEWPSD